MLAYLLLKMHPVEAGGKTMNQVLTEQVHRRDHARAARFVAGTFVTGHHGHRRGVCSSRPHRPALSTARACWPTWRTTPTCRTGSAACRSGWPAHNGILLMGSAALAALWVHGGSVSTLSIMYSINVFVTFLAVDDRHVAALVWRSAASTRYGGGGLALFSVAAVYVFEHSCRNDLRKVRSRRLGYPAVDRGVRHVFSVDPSLLSSRVGTAANAWTNR